MIIGVRTDTTASGTLSSAALIMLVLALGATIYLHRTGYVRRNTGIITTLVLVFALLALGLWIYRTG